ncbi:MAG: TRAP transporter small permease [Burkholderiaceae bacterium]
MIGTQAVTPQTAPAWLARLCSAIDSLGRFGGTVAAIALALLTLIILSEISVRMLSNFFAGIPAGVPMAWEYSSYLMGIAFMAGAAMTLRAGSHIRVTILIGQLPASGKRLLEIVSSLGGFFLTAFLAWSLALFTWGSYTRGQTSISSDTPVWIPEAAITFGAVLLALQMLARTLQAIWNLPLEDPSLKVAGVSE